MTRPWTGTCDYCLGWGLTVHEIWTVSTRFGWRVRVICDPCNQQHCAVRP